MQQSLTYERLITTSTKLTFAYYQKKEYFNAPILSSNLNGVEPAFLLDRLAMHSGVVSSGQSEAQGIELLLEKTCREFLWTFLAQPILTQRIKIIMELSATETIIISTLLILLVAII